MEQELHPLVLELTLQGAAICQQVQDTADSLAAFLTPLTAVVERAGGEEGKALGSLVSWHKGLQGGLERVAQALRGEAFLRLKSDNESFKKNNIEMEKRDRKEVRKLREHIKKREDSLERSEQARGMAGSRSRKLHLDSLREGLARSQEEAARRQGRAESSHLRSVTEWLWPVLAQESGLGKQLGPLPLQHLVEVLSKTHSSGQQLPPVAFTMEGVPVDAGFHEEDWSGQQLPTADEEIEQLFVELPTHQTTFLLQPPETLEDVKADDLAKNSTLPELSMGPRSESADSLTSLISTLSPINPSPLCNRKKGTLTRRHSMSMKVSPPWLSRRPAPAPPLRKVSLPDVPPTFSTVRRRCSSPIGLQAPTAPCVRQKGISGGGERMARRTSESLWIERRDEKAERKERVEREKEGKVDEGDQTLSEGRRGSSSSGYSSSPDTVTNQPTLSSFLPLPFPPRMGRPPLPSPLPSFSQRPRLLRSHSLMEWSTPGQDRTLQPMPTAWEGWNPSYVSQSPIYQ